MQAIQTRSVTVVVVDKDNKVLLHQREDFRIWSLPGGHIDKQENWQTAAIREVYEETGYMVEIERLVGEYWQPEMPNGGEIKYVCAGRIIGGEAIKRGPETLQVKWFDIEGLPFSLSGFMREYIADTQLNESHPLKKSQHLPKWQSIGIKYLLKIRDFRNRLLNRI